MTFLNLNSLFTDENLLKRVLKESIIKNDSRRVVVRSTHCAVGKADDLEKSLFELVV